MPAADEERIDDALAALFRLAADPRLHERRLAQTGTEITATGHRLLDQLTEHGPASVSQLASALQLTLPTASRQLQQLERMGFVARRPGSGRRSGRHLRLHHGRAGGTAPLPDRDPA